MKVESNNMNNKTASDESMKMPEIDVQKEMEMMNLNTAMLNNQLLQQQLRAGYMELRASKIATLQKIVDHVQGEELKEKIQTEISKLLGELISIPL